MGDTQRNAHWQKRKQELRTKILHQQVQDSDEDFPYETFRLILVYF